MTFLGWLSDPFKGLSDLQLGDQKVTLNHLVGSFFRCSFVDYTKGPLRPQLDQARFVFFFARGVWTLGVFEEIFVQYTPVN